MKALKQFLIGLFGGIGFLTLFASFVGFVNNYFGYNAAMVAVWVFLAGIFIFVLYINYRKKELSHIENVKNLSKEVVELTKALGWLIGIVFIAVVAIGAFIYLASQIGKLGATGVIILLLVIISFQLSSILKRLE